VYSGRVIHARFEKIQEMFPIFPAACRRISREYAWWRAFVQEKPKCAASLN